MDFTLAQKLTIKNDAKVVLMILDGLGGIPGGKDGKTELEAASAPNLDALARDGICGLHQPIGTGITPGSGPAHLSVFGYDPIKHQVGRGVLAALGVDFELKDGDVAARGNFCTVDSDGLITDRRVNPVRLPPQSPNLNAHLERFMKSIKDEALHRMIFIGEDSLWRSISSYLEHYHGERNHQGLRNRIIEPGDELDNNGGTVQRSERLGGLLCYYYRDAA